MKNEDDECFRWCHIRHVKPKDTNPNRIKKSDKQYINKLDYSGIEFPVTIKQYSKIEKQNEININVFGYENKQPYPIYVSKEKFVKHIELKGRRSSNLVTILIKRTRLLNVKDMFRQLLCHRQFTDGITMMNNI